MSCFKLSFSWRRTSPEWCWLVLRCAVCMSWWSCLPHRPDTSAHLPCQLDTSAWEYFLLFSGPSSKWMTNRAFASIYLWSRFIFLHMLVRLVPYLHGKESWARLAPETTIRHEGWRVGGDFNNRRTSIQLLRWQPSSVNEERGVVMIGFVLPHVRAMMAIWV